MRISRKMQQGVEETVGRPFIRDKFTYVNFFSTFSCTRGKLEDFKVSLYIRPCMVRMGNEFYSVLQNLKSKKFSYISCKGLSSTTLCNCIPGYRNRKAKKSLLVCIELLTSGAENPITSCPLLDSVINVRRFTDDPYNYI
jgi:hypothetical protein